MRILRLTTISPPTRATARDMPSKLRFKLFSIRIIQVCKLDRRTVRMEKLHGCSTNPPCTTYHQHPYSWGGEGPLMMTTLPESLEKADSSIGMDVIVAWGFVARAVWPRF